MLGGNKTTQYALLRGIGNRYGHIVRVKVLEYKLYEYAKIVTEDGEELIFDHYGFEARHQKEIGYTTYQLSWESFKHDQSERRYLNEIR